jgi:preprotein translocase subunit SecG
MSLYIFLTVLQALIALGLVGVILMQRSEGGGLGVGGSPSGLMSARGAADFLTRATAVLAALFVLLSIILAALAVNTGSSRTVDTSLQRAAPAPVAPLDPLSGAAQSGRVPAPAASPAAPAPAPVDPLSGAAKQ